MVTKSHFLGLLSAHRDGDRERFSSIANQAAAKEESLGRRDLASRIRGYVNGTNGTLKPLPIEDKGYLRRIEPKHRLENLFLSEETKKALSSFVVEWEHREALRERGLEPRRRILLWGPPGTGKTATAGALAIALGLPFYLVRLEGVIDSYLGNTAKHLRDVFDAVRTNAGVYFLDEFDAVGATRKIGGKDFAEMRRALSSLLQFLEEDFPSVVIAATNMKELLDHAVFRRFELVVTYGLPSSADGMALVRRLLERVKIELRPPNGTHLDLACTRVSHAEIENAVLSAARKAIVKGEDNVGIRDILEHFPARDPE